MSAATGTSKKRLALAIIDYLNTSVSDGTINSEEAESIEIATNCIAEAFKVDPSDEVATKDALGGQSLLSIYSVYEKLKGKSTASTTGSSSAAEARPSTPAAPQTPGAKAAAGEGLDEKTKAEAEKFKSQGNAAIQKKDYASAIDLYTKALDLNPLHPIYLSNRAAAYSGAGQHEDAKNDAEMAVAADPNFAKAWSRLGLAKFALGDPKGSMEAYKKGIDAEGNGGSEAMRKGYETAKKKVEEDEDFGDDSADDAVGARDGGNPFGSGAGGMPDLASLAGMFGGGAGGGGGGMPGGLAEMMNNPMMRQMAQNIMSNPEQLSSLMNNPALRNMMGGAGGAPGGSGTPDLASLMQDPAIADMAKQFMGGAGGAPGAGRGRGA